ncbi:MAG: DDE-type integrase/transposase/recombinase [Burkholderia sp.]
MKHLADTWFYLCLIMDIYSRKVIAWEVHGPDDVGVMPSGSVQRAALAERIAADEQRPVLHGDNGSTLEATTVLAMLHWLGVKLSYSRPRVSDDNAFVESLFHTSKYRPPSSRRTALQTWTPSGNGRCAFVHWYHNEHRHSGIRYVTPARWLGQTPRNCPPTGSVALNPELGYHPSTRSESGVINRLTLHDRGDNCLDAHRPADEASALLVSQDG